VVVVVASMAAHQDGRATKTLLASSTPRAQTATVTAVAITTTPAWAVAAEPVVLHNSTTPAPPPAPVPAKAVATAVASHQVPAPTPLKKRRQAITRPPSRIPTIRRRAIRLLRVARAPEVAGTRATAAAGSPSTNRSLPRVTVGSAEASPSTGLRLRAKVRAALSQRSTCAT